MNRIFLKTSLAGALLVLAGPVFAADPIKMTVSGEMKEWFGVTRQDGALDPASASQGKEKFNHTGMDTQTFVAFGGDTKLDNGLTVTARLQLDVLTNYGPNVGSTQVHESSVAIAGDLGTIRGGIKETANNTMHNEAPDVGITYSSVGDWVTPPKNFTTFAQPVNGIPNPVPYNFTSFAAFTDKQPAVSYISPTFLDGFSLGASYVPGSGAVGPVNTLTTSHNVWESTLAYTKEIKGVTVGLDGGISQGKGPKNGPSTVSTALSPGSYFSQSFTAYEGGAKFAYGAWTLGGAYLGMREHRAPCSDIGTCPVGAGTNSGIPLMTGYSWDAGLSYVNGPYGASVSYYTEQHRGGYQLTAKQPVVGVLGKPETFQTGLVSGSYELTTGITSRSTLFYGKFAGIDGTLANKSDGYGLVTGLDLVF
ncbi:MAG: porin [Alphaproteobacteria bacterium]|nr:porin [Alphaproteobacteria bacterium]